MSRVRSLAFAIAVLCIAALAAGLPARAAQPAQTSPPFPGLVTDDANLRAGPGANYDRIGGVPAGQTVQVSACNDLCDWYELDGGAWIAAFLVQPQNVSPGSMLLPTSTAPAASALPPQNLIPAQVLAVTEGDTLRVRVNDRDAVVRYLGIDSPDGGPGREAASTANEALTSRKLVYLEQDVSDADIYGRLLRYVWLQDGRLLNQELVRLGCAVATIKAPDLKYEDRLQRAQNAAVEAKRTCSWLDTAPTGLVVITPAAPTLTPTPAATPKPTVVARSSGGKKTGAANTTANLRKGPSTEYEIVGQVFRGDAVQIDGCNEPCDWLQLNTGQWVLAELITVAATPAAAPSTERVVNVSASAPGSGQQYGVVTADWLNVRAGPGTGEAVVGGLANGACVEVVTLQPDWAQIKLAPAQTGWCTRDYLSLASVCPTPAPVAQSRAGNVAIADAQYAAGCAATSVKANAIVVSNTFGHECFGEGNGGLREVSAGTPVELLGVGAFQPPADQAEKLGAGPFFKARIWDGQVAWLPASAVNADPATYPQVSAMCEACDKLEWAQVPRIRDAPTPVPLVASRAPSYSSSYGGSSGGSASSCCKICTTGKACGNSCISRSYTCHKGPGCACNG